MDKTKTECLRVHKTNKWVTETKKCKDVIAITFSLVVNFKKLLRSCDYNEVYTVAGKILVLFQVVVTGYFLYSNYIERTQ